MSSPLELDDVLTRLHGSRRRLREMTRARPDPGRHPEQLRVAVLVDELNDVSEQLLVADEELRVQQAELDDTRDRLERAASERDALWLSSPVARVVTDAHGVVLRANRAADSLVRRPMARLTPHPVASWFEVPDRASVRSAIGRLGLGSDHQTVTARLRGRHDDAVIVDVVVESVDREDAGELLWEFTPQVVAREPVLRVVGPEASELPTMTTLASLATRLAAMPSSAEVIEAMLAAAHVLLPTSEGVGLAVQGRAGPQSQPGSSDLVSMLDQAQTEYGDGPLHEVFRTEQAAVVPDVGADPRWPRFAAAAEALCVGSLLVAPLPGGLRRRAALTWTATRRGAFDEVSVAVASAFAAHVAAAVGRADDSENLRTAVASRQEIGEAVGILMERHKVTETAAFQLLAQASQRSNTKLRDLARLVVATGEDPHLGRPR